MKKWEGEEPNGEPGARQEKARAESLDRYADAF